MHKSNWDNLRFVLTVADAGSVSAAARALGVNHATVLRRVAAFEAAHGGAVFAKSANGYRVLPERARVIDAAREVAESFHSVERLMHGARAPLRGVVRVSSTDSICQLVLPPLLARLNAESSELRIELLSTNSRLDFARQQADITVRPALALPDEMAGSSAARLVFHAYSAASEPETWLNLTGALSQSAPAAWMSQNIAPEQVSGSADSFLVLRELAKLGMGIAVLPAFVGDAEPDLIRRTGLFPETSVPVWVGSHAELHDVPRIRIVRTRILDYLSAGLPPVAAGD